MNPSTRLVAIRRPYAPASRLESGRRAAAAVGGEGSGDLEALDIGQADIEQDKVGAGRERPQARTCRRGLADDLEAVGL